MKIDLAKVSETGTPLDTEIPAEEIETGDENIRLTGPVRVKGEFVRKGETFEFNGTIEGDAESSCTRCLKVLERPLNIKYHAVYAREDELAREQSAEVETADLDTDVIADDTLDMAEAAREQILLSIPEQIFCREDCKGLCSMCGADLNLIDCNCKESETDPRWAALKDLD